MSAALDALLAARRLLIFDLDGTLVDSSPLHARAFAEVFAPFNVTIDYSMIAGMTTEAAIDRVAALARLQLDQEARAMLIATKRSRAQSLIEAELKAFPGALAFIRATAGRWTRALCTSASRANALAALRCTELAGYFDWIITAEDVTRGKPDPEAFLAVLKHARVPATDAVVFEDAASGLAAAAAAGIATIEVVSGEARPGGKQANWSMLNDALGRCA